MISEIFYKKSSKFKTQAVVEYFNLFFSLYLKVVASITMEEK